MDRHRIATPALSATIKADGAELCSLRDSGGLILVYAPK